MNFQGLLTGLPYRARDLAGKAAFGLAGDLSGFLGATKESFKTVGKRGWLEGRALFAWYTHLGLQSLPN